MKKRIISAIMVSSIILGTVVLPSTVLADDYDTEIEQSNKKISELSNQEAAAAQQLASVRSNIDSIKTQAGALQAEQMKLNGDIEKLGKEIESLTVRIGKRDATIKEQARSVQVDGQATNFIDAILTSDSVSSAITRVTAASKLVSASNDLMKQQEADKNDVETKKSVTEEKVEKVNQNASELEQQKGQLIDQELHQTVLVNQIAASRETEVGKKASFQAKKEAAEQERAEQARLVKAAEQAAADNVVKEVEVNSDTPATDGGQGDGNVAPPSDGGNANVTPPSNGGNNGNITPPKPSKPAPPTPPSPNASGSSLVAEAYKHIGKPYTQEAGRRQGPDAFDCSGFTDYVYRQVTGRSIGGWTVPQEGAGTQIAVSQAQAGDLLFWGGRGNTHHVALAIGGGQYIHAPTYGQTVTVASVSSYFMPTFAVRVL